MYIHENIHFSMDGRSFRHTTAIEGTGGKYPYSSHSAKKTGSYKDRVLRRCYMYMYIIHAELGLGRVMHIIGFTAY